MLKLVLLLLLGGTTLLVLGLSLLGNLLGAQTLSASAQVSGQLTRLNQLDPSQYASTQEFARWSSATCSAASMTEVLNAYGQHLHISDVLAVEIRLGGISPAQGMLRPEVIAQTVSAFGFQDRALSHPTLAALIALANAGTPAIVDFPPAPGPWAGGHLLVLRGGDQRKVQLVDSSSLNLQQVPQNQFLLWWGGHADLVFPAQPTRPAGIPTPPPASLTNPYAQQAWQIAQTYHLPPTLFVAQIRQESNFNPRAVSSAGAVGIAQFLPATAACLDHDGSGRCLSIDPWNPTEALSGAAYLMEKQWLAYLPQSPKASLTAYRKALAAYNAGTGQVSAALRLCGLQWESCLPAETQQYITSILQQGGF